MKKTKIEWCDSTWNPVTGCLHGCEYCYARKIAERFGGKTPSEYGKIQVIDALGRTTDGKSDPYPFGFLPTFHHHRLDEPQRWAKPRNIFVCSMADLFGDWVPDRWIEEVFAACERAPQHRHLFLTKNPKRYLTLARAGELPERDNMWYGTTTTTPDEEFFWGGAWNTFVSIEPILRDYTGEVDNMCDRFTQWVIVGAESGNRKGKVIPEARWLTDIIETCTKRNIALFMKDSLVPIVGEENMRREFPWKQEITR